MNYRKHCEPKVTVLLTSILVIAICCSVQTAFSQTVSDSAISEQQKSYEHLKEMFLDLPVAEKQTGPLYWIQEEGNTKPKDQEYAEIMVEGGNGHCTIESRIYQQWLTPSWFEIVDTILNEMKNRGAKVYIFDEKWFPSFDVDGNVPQQYRTKLLKCSAEDVVGEKTYKASGHDGEFYIKTVAGKVVGEQIDSSQLIDLTPQISKGTLTWDVPEGNWRIMKFTWEYNKSWGNTRLLDLASLDAAEWFIDTVIKPHYEKTSAPDAIAGFFFDEPEFFGQWGIGMERDNPRWKEMLVHRFYNLTGEAQKKAQYLYMKTLADRIGRVGYGTYRKYVNSRGGKVIGHFWEHNQPVAWGAGPIDIMEVQKYCDMGGIDYVLPGRAAPVLRSKEKGILYQMGRLGASISITANMDKHLSMNECYAGYALGDYTFIKWSSDLSTIQGSQVLIPHSFNPGNYGEDWKPFFYRSGTESSWPLYKVWAERQNRLAYMMQGNDESNYRIAPVAVLWPGVSKYVGQCTLPYNLLSAFESANYDPILITSTKLEEEAVVNPATKSIDLYNSSFKVLALPSVEYVSNTALVKAREFYDNGGVVIAWGTVPSKSATFDATNAQVQENIEYLFGNSQPTAGSRPVKMNAAGGKTFYVSEQEDVALLTSEIKDVMADSGVRSTFKVLAGTDADEEWVIYQHRKRDGHDVFMIWNANDKPRNFTARLTATGYPEIWHPMSKKITQAVYKRLSDDEVDVTFKLNPEEVVLVVFKPLGSNTSVCQTDVDELLDIRNEGAQSEVDVLVSENKDYNITLNDGSQNYEKSFSVSGIPSSIPVVDATASIPSEYLDGNYVIYLDVGSAKSARVNVNQDYIPLKGNAGFAGGVIGSTSLVDVASKVIEGNNHFQIQPEDPGDAQIRIFKKMTIAGFKCD